MVTCKYHTYNTHFWDIFHSKVALNFLSLIDILFAMLKFLVFPLIQTGGLRIEAVVCCTDCKALYSNTGICDFELQMS